LNSGNARLTNRSLRSRTPGQRTVMAPFVHEALKAGEFIQFLSTQA
jgi:hypothetical protein